MINHKEVVIEAGILADDLVSLDKILFYWRSFYAQIFEFFKRLRTKRKQADSSK